MQLLKKSIEKPCGRLFGWDECPLLDFFIESLLPRERPPKLTTENQMNVILLFIALLQGIYIEVPCVAVMASYRLVASSGIRLALGANLLHACAAVKKKLRFSRCQVAPMRMHRT